MDNSRYFKLRDREETLNDLLWELNRYKTHNDRNDWKEYYNAEDYGIWLSKLHLFLNNLLDETQEELLVKLS